MKAKLKGRYIFFMKTVTQTILYRQTLISYAGKYGVIKTAISDKTYIPTAQKI